MKVIINSKDLKEAVEDSLGCTVGVLPEDRLKLVFKLDGVVIASSRLSVEVEIASKK